MIQVKRRNPRGVCTLIIRSILAHPDLHPLALDVEKKAAEVSASPASTMTPQLKNLEPEDVGTGAKLTKRKSRREKNSQTPDESKIDEATLDTEGPSGSSRTSTKHQSDHVPRTAPSTSNHSTIQRVSPTWSNNCPICRQPGQHYQYACPIVLGDLDQLEQRVSEMRKEGHDTALMHVMEGFLTSARKKRNTNSDSTGTPGSKDASIVPKSSVYQPSFSPKNLGAPSSIGESKTSLVAVNGQESGAESSDSETSGSENEVEAKPPPSNAARSPMFPQVPSGTPWDADALLEDLMRGPVHPSRTILADIPSDSDTASDSDGMESEDPEREDEENDKSFRRLARRLHQGDSSDDEQGAEDDEAIVPPTFMDVDNKDPTQQVCDIGNCEMFATLTLPAN